MNAHAPQRRPDAKGAQFGILLQLADGVLGGQIDCAHRTGIGPRFVLEPTYSLACPARECVVDRGPRNHQVPSDAGRCPAFSMQGHDGMATGGRLRDLGVARISATGTARGRTIYQHLLNRVRAGPTSEAHVADRGDLVQAQLGVFSLEIDDALSHGRRERAMGIPLLLGCRAHEAVHSLYVELLGRPAQRPFGRTRLLRPLRGEIPKQDDGTSSSNARCSGQRQYCLSCCQSSVWA